MEWTVTGTITPNQAGGFDVDLRASKPTSRGRAAPTIAAGDVDYEARIKAAERELGSALGELAGQMADVMAAQNKSRKVSARRVLHEVYDPLVKAAAKFDHQALAYGMQQAIGREIPNVTWAKKAASSYNESVTPLPQGLPSATASTSSKYDILGGGRQK